MAPGTKPGKDAKSAPKQSTKNEKFKDKDKINPFQRPTKNMSRAGDLRKQRDAFNVIIAEEQAQKAREIKELEEKIAYYKKDNEKLLRQQTAKFGLTLDNLEVVREELDQARLTNDSLYRDLESKKEECDKLQSTMDNVLKKISEAMIDSSDLNRERRIYEQEREQVARNEIRIHQLVQSNKDMRALLLKHKINPNVDASKIHVKSSSPRSEISHKSSTLPVIYNRQNLTSFRSEEEGRPLRQKRKLKGILRRSKSNNCPEFINAREYFRRRPSYPVEIYV